jgi:hypothetical protein
MRTISHAIAVAANLAIACVPLAAQTKTSDAPHVYTIPAASLQRIREDVRSGHERSPAIASVRAAAERAMKVAPLSVIDKSIIPPSGDKHDYMSLAPYWWPDPKSPNGLPYLRHDGERNPELATMPDHKNFDTVMNSAHALALGYYLFGEEKYAAKATELLHAWFVDPRTRMNSNLQYAQAVRGVNDGRGTGLIETRSIGKVVDAVGMLEGSKVWTAADDRALHEWCSAFLDWMLTSKNGKDEAAARNNHGTFYDVQIASLALFTGRKDLARSVIQQAAHKRIETHVQPDGSQPLELARTKSFSYSAFNLTALFELARLGEVVGVDLWAFRGKNGASIRAALDYLLPYANGDRAWTHKQIEPIKAKELAPLLLEAAERYRAPEYRAMATKIDPDALQTLQALLIQSGHSALAKQ